MVRINNRRRRGTVLPMLVVSLVALMGFVALAIDLGVLAITRLQVQNAADIGSLVGNRTLNGDTTTNYNFANCEPAARTACKANVVWGTPITDPMIDVKIGSYSYNSSQQKFVATIPDTGNYSAVQVTVTSSGTPSMFGGVFGANTLATVTGLAQAVHRPRDLALVLDYSGSMGNGSKMGMDVWTARTAEAGGENSGTNNPDPVIPTFGHYSSPSAGIKYAGGNRNYSQGSSTWTYSPTNTTYQDPGNPNRKPLVLDFYSNNAFAATLTRAFTSETSVDSGVTWVAPAAGATPQIPAAVGGDTYLFTGNAGTNYATTVTDITGANTRNAGFEFDGYSYYYAANASVDITTQKDYSNCAFKGYIQGPGYWGKTFFMWPPDPRVPLLKTGWSNTTEKAWLTQMVTDLGGGMTNANLFDLTDANVNGIISGWPWAMDAGVTLTNYLTSNQFLMLDGSKRKLKSDGTDKSYNAVMRLYNRAYMLQDTSDPTGNDTRGTASADWRRRFFYQPGTTTPTDNNTRFWNSNGFLSPSGGPGYGINYTEILYWLKNCGPNPFPSQIRAGRIKYYTSIPTTIPSSGRTNDQEFWKQYIDFVLGLHDQGGGNWNITQGTGSNGTNSYNSVDTNGHGPLFTWGTVQITDPTTANGRNQYMDYNDNPKRPRGQMWFGPMSFVDFIFNENQGRFLTSADCHEAPLYTSKQAVQGALQDMQNNHPNDMVSLIFYSGPKNSQGGGGRFNFARSALSNDANYGYNYAINTLWFPHSTLASDGTSNGTEIWWNDATFSEQVAHANGGTTFSMGLMLAHNQFCTTDPTDATLRSFVTTPGYPAGLAGGQGRRGAQKIVIFETDGIINGGANASLVSVAAVGSTPAYKYYPIRYDPGASSGNEFPSTTGSDLPNVYGIIDTMKTQFGSSRKPVRIFCIGFGPVYDPGGPETALGLGILAQMQALGTPTATNPAVPLDTSQIVIGTDAQMQALLQTSIGNVMQGGLQCALIK